jgi:hypothetical protein
LINSAGIWSLPSNSYFFNFSITVSTSKDVGSGTNGSAVCILV